ncbi:polysaccharide biosynthesis tyrosine autokinase [Vibrio sp. SM6]|uniref:non-specific protein-tyrosine kinase n=1 Tax=Vibrio agarilyticus TaxID=2726741 RepID=A0A7X8TTL3_9VIBR|nr:polysaccharide biosynthesis tyrosine autokinase [Vibrio agarilyticus]NLS14386.1 polysaccharide biosynthesis tyrosine autokinase [Vibrio agarilyticus]
MDVSQTQKNKPDHDEIDLGKLFQILRKRIWVIFLFTLLCAALATLFVKSIPPGYTASATLLLDSQQNNTVSIEDVVGVDNSKKEYFLTQLEILKSNQLAERVIAQLRLKDLPEFNGYLEVDDSSLLNQIQSIYRSLPVYKALFESEGQQFDPALEQEKLRQRVLNNFRAGLTVVSVGKTQLVKISFTSLDAKLAARIANEVGHTYIDMTLESKIGATQDASSWLSRRAEELKLQLAESERALTDFLTSEGLVDSSGIDNLTSNELAELSKKLSDARSRRVAAESIFQVLKDNSSTDIVAMASVSEIANHPQVKKMLTLETEAENRINELAKRYGPKHDKMIQAQSQYSAVKAQSETFIRKLASGIEQELKSVRQLEVALNNEMLEKKDEFQEIAVKRARYDILKREVATNRELFELFLTRQKETSATSDFTPISVRFTDEALVPLVPSKPKKALIVVLASLLGLMVSVASTLLLEVFRNTFQATNDYSEEFGLTPLGCVPYVANVKSTINADYFAKDFNQHSKTGFSEAFQSIRTSLLINYLNSDKKIYAVTSALPSEGKTTTSLNIGLAMAASERVLLIDTDLRRPSLAGRFGLSNTDSGLTHYLLMGHDIDSCIHHIEAHNIDVMPAGFVAPNPQQVLSSERFVQLLDDLATKYDRIIVDTPPMLLFSDALTVLSLIKSVIVVSRINQSKKEQLRQTLDKLFTHNIHLDGLVVNGIKRKNEESYSYYSEYQYHYHNDVSGKA